MLYDSIYITFSKCQNYRDEEQIRAGQGLGMVRGKRAGCGDRRVAWEIFVMIRYSVSREQWCSHQSEWPSSKHLQIINAGEGVEKRKPSCTVDGNVN